MNILINLLIVVEIIASILLILVILIQPSKSGGLGGALGGGMGEQLFGARTGNVMTKATIVLASIFLANTLLLTVLYSAGSDLTPPAATPPSPGMMDGGEAAGESVSVEEVEDVPAPPAETVAETVAEEVESTTETPTETETD